MIQTSAKTLPRFRVLGMMRCMLLHLHQKEFQLTDRNCDPGASRGFRIPNRFPIPRQRRAEPILLIGTVIPAQAVVFDQPGQNAPPATVKVPPADPESVPNTSTN